MENFFIWGFEIVEFFSKIRNPILNYFFYFLSFIGSEKFYLLILPLIYWCIDEKKAFKLSIIFFLSSFLNEYLKILFKTPRPFVLKKDIAISYEESYSFPSGHAQGSATVYGIISLWFKGLLKVIFLIVIPFLVALSRIYLGVHYPIDVIVGLFLGYFIVLLFYNFEYKIENFFVKKSLIFKILTILLIDIILIFINPESSSISGVFLGIGLGYIFYRAKYDINTVKEIEERFYTNNQKKANTIVFIKKTLKYLIGLIFILIFYFGLSFLFPKKEEQLYHFFRYIRYFLIGYWISLIYPLIYMMVIKKIKK